MQFQTITFTRKKDAIAATGGLTQTTKMPCKSWSIPVAACQTGWRLAQIPGTICSKCYADKGNYAKYHATIEPAQHARLAALDEPDLWIGGMTALISFDPYFRWLDAGDIQSLLHLEMIAEVCRRTPRTKHWLPTREYGIVKEFVAKHGVDGVPPNLVIRLSAMYIDKPVTIPKSLKSIRGIATSNVHSKHTTPTGERCPAPTQKGQCLSCRTCWTPDTVVSYEQH
jgi:uncharacterized protein CbrC (UPF0167 family)